METITRIAPDGVPEWASDREVIKAHFRRREEGSDHVEDEGSHHPMILSLWHAEIKKDGLARAAVRAMRAEKAEREKQFHWKTSKEPAKHTNAMVLEYAEMQRQEEEERLEKARQRRASIEAKQRLEELDGAPQGWGAIAMKRRGSTRGGAKLAPQTSLLAANAGVNDALSLSQRMEALGRLGVNTDQLLALTNLGRGPGAPGAAPAGGASLRRKSLPSALPWRPASSPPPAADSSPPSGREGSPARRLSLSRRRRSSASRRSPLAESSASPEREAGEAGVRPPDAKARLPPPIDVASEVLAAIEAAAAGGRPPAGSPRQGEEGQAVQEAEAQAKAAAEATVAAAAAAAEAAALEEEAAEEAEVAAEAAAAARKAVERRAAAAAEVAAAESSEAHEAAAAARDALLVQSDELSVAAAHEHAEQLADDAEQLAGIAGSRKRRPTSARPRLQTVPSRPADALGNAALDEDVAVGRVNGYAVRVPGGADDAGGGAACSAVGVQWECGHAAAAVL